MCCSKGLLKRLVPFFAAFALSLLVASFFVTVAPPNIRFARGVRHRDYDRRMKCENQRLRAENFRLRQASGEFNVQPDNAFDEGDVRNPVPPLAPPSVK